MDLFKSESKTSNVPSIAIRARTRKSKQNNQPTILPEPLSSPSKEQIAMICNEKQLEHLIKIGRAKTIFQAASKFMKEPSLDFPTSPLPKKPNAGAGKADLNSL